jgi:phenylpyruvate tautomerase PptA (4-oxalocrotonate tautomerase family)
MPIVDVQVVRAAGAGPDPAAQPLADALGRVFGSAPGRTWVRVSSLDAASYAENDVALGAGELPAFVTVLHAHPPTGAALAAQVLAVTEAVAGCLGLPADRVHVQMAPAGAGRQAFGGKLVE